MARTTMWLLAITNLGYMVWVLFDPETGARFMGLVPGAPIGQVELRAMYAGLIGGLGIINLIGAINPTRLTSALWASAWLLGSVGLVRGISCVALGFGGWHAVFTGFELAAALVCAGLMRMQTNDLSTSTPPV
ncbi:MAG: hypothetical protein VX589_01145 [Myxococcota bacterium]|nr:hypothetical protein [Myxococcota bacterium]